MYDLAALRVCAWTLMALGLAAAVLDLASRYLVGERGVGNMLLSPIAGLVGVALLRASNLLERHETDLAARREQQRTDQT
jgi:hypothetical protein